MCWGRRQPLPLCSGSESHSPALGHSSGVLVMAEFYQSELKLSLCPGKPTGLYELEMVPFGAYGATLTPDQSHGSRYETFFCHMVNVATGVYTFLQHQTLYLRCHMM